ncbi:hypothetical protein RvY_06359 [Ramazzottius varieornatus]|uniref:DHHA2 domain-containing protein n=1 Tax=Ramazzottius varieornatus TaxID=947166 RepID=A0A1D1UYU9_RAMVA|nr:hypothetical protein RvY_06359 [Ramazzottius varieornatus]
MMDRPEETLREYLRMTKKTVLDKDLDKFPRVHIVVGNEACDLDSCVSALIYAYYIQTSEERQAKSRVDRFTIPLLNIPQEDFTLKSEVRFALKKQGIDESCLIFLDEVQLLPLASKVDFTLVDHHVPTGKLAQMKAVTEIVDHHPFQQQHPDALYLKNVKKRTIEAVGSCATLIAEKVLGWLTDKGALTLLYETIILDTVNFSPSAKKATAKDVDMADKLEAKLGKSGLKASRADILAQLNDAKSDVGSLSTAQLLRKDVKMLSSAAGTVMVSSLPILVKDYFNDEKRQQELRQLTQLAVVLGVSIKSKNISRDLLVYAADANLLSKVSGGLLRSTNPPLSLATSEAAFRPSNENFRYYSQTNVAASRKQILPLLADILGEAASASPPKSPFTSEGTSAFTGANSGTVTPPNSYIGQSFLQHDTHAIFAGVNRKMQQELETTGRGQKEEAEMGSSRTPNEPFTPSNTFVDESARILMRGKFQDNNELQSKVERLKLQREGASASGSAQSSRHPSAINDDREGAVFHMDDETDSNQRKE